MTLMDLATIGAKALKKQGLLNSLDESEEINACSVKIKVDDGEEQTGCFSLKTRPTTIQPKSNRSAVLQPVWAAQSVTRCPAVLMFIRHGVTGAGNPLTPFEDTIKGKLPQKKIELTPRSSRPTAPTATRIGLATGQAANELYHPSRKTHGGRRSCRRSSGRKCGS